MFLHFLSIYCKKCRNRPILHGSQSLKPIERRAASNTHEVLPKFLKSRKIIQSMFKYILRSLLSMLQVFPALKTPRKYRFNKKLLTATAATALTSPGRCDANLGKFEKCTFRKNRVYSVMPISNRANYASEFRRFLARFLQGIIRFLAALFDF